MLIVLFLKCVTSLLNPVYPRGERIKWGLVSYTVLMFAFATVDIATKAQIFSISYIDDCKFPGVEDELFPGLFGYQLRATTSYKAIGVVPIAAFRLANWSADGLLVGFSSGPTVACPGPQC